MVLRDYGKPGIFVLTAAIGLSPSTLYAQYVGQAAPSLRVSDPEYTSAGVNLGPIKVFSDIDFDLIYDNNVFAEPAGEDDDLVLNITPRTELRYQSGSTTVRALAAANFRRFVDLDTENSTSAVVETEVIAQPSIGDTFSVLGGWTRGVEDRGDPEARNDTSVGPRLSDIYTGRLGYNRQQGQISFKIDGEVRKYSNVSALDADRDLISYAGRTTIGYRVSGNIFATATGFVTRRSFRVPVNIFGVNRNATTYGGRLGLQMDPGGKLEGGASAGIFRSDSASINPEASFTGLSVDASLVYRPRQRTAITFDAFRGDVATFRLGAVARTDTQVGLGVQQEIRHNLFAAASAFYRESKFRGLGADEQITGVQAEIEYLFNRNAAVAATVRYSKRDSDEATEQYSRFRIGAELRLSF